MKKLKLKTLNIISKKNSKSVIELELTASYTFMASNKRDVCRKEGEVRGEKAGAGGYFFVNNQERQEGTAKT